MAGKLIDIDLEGSAKMKAFLIQFQSRLDTAIPAVLTSLQSGLIQIATDDIRKIFALSPDKISAGLKVRPTSGGVELIGSGKGVSLISFSGTYGGRLTPGASVLVTVARGRATVAESFIPKNIKQIFRRDGKSRYPIRKLYGPSVAQMLKRDEVVSNITEFADKTMSDKADELMK